MLVLWLLLTGSRVASASYLSQSAPFSGMWPRFGSGLGRPAAVESQCPVSEMAAYLDDPALPSRSTSHDHRRGVRLIFQLTALRRVPAVRTSSRIWPAFTSGDPRAAQKTFGTLPPSRFSRDQSEPVLASAQAGEGHLFFVDAAHFVFGPSRVCGRSRGSSSSASDVSCSVLGALMR